MNAHQITITNNHASLDMLQNRTVYIEIDHAALVAANRSFADGRDLVIVYGPAVCSGAGYRLVSYPVNLNSSATRLYFSLQDDISASGGEDSNYWLVFGNEHQNSKDDFGLRKYSQIDSWAKGGQQNDPRKQPFLWFEDWTKEYEGGEFIDYTDFDQPDDSLYDRITSSPRIRVFAEEDNYLRFTLSGLYSTLLEEDWEDTGANGWTLDQTHGTIDPDNTSSPLSGSEDLKLTWSTPGANPDSRCFAFKVFSEQDGGKEYVAARFAFRINTGWQQATNTTMEICSLQTTSPLSTRGYIYLNRNAFSQYGLQLQQVSPNLRTTGTYNIFSFGTIYYMEFRSYPDNSTGGLMLKVYSDASYTTEIGSLSIDGTGGGWSTPALMGRLTFGTLASGNRNPQGSWQFDDIHVFEPGESYYTYAEGLFDWTTLPGMRVHCEYFVESGADAPDSGVAVFAQPEESDVQAYTLGLSGSYTSVALQERTPTPADLDTDTVDDESDSWVPLELGAYNDSGTVILKGKIGTAEVGLSASDASPSFTSGHPGFWQHGSAGVTKAAHFRNFWVELWDGVGDSEYTAEITIAAPDFPSSIGIGVGEDLGLSIAKAEYPEFIIPQGATISIVDTDEVSIYWNHLDPSSLSELRAFYVAQRGGAKRFSATVAKVGSGDYQIVPGSLSYQLASNNSYRAQIRIRKLW